MNGTNLTIGIVSLLAAASRIRPGTRQGTRNADDGPRWLMCAGGDVNPLEYGGSWITIHPDGSLSLWWVYGIDGYSNESIEVVLAAAGHIDVDPDDSDIADTIWPHQIWQMDISDDVLAYHSWVKPQDLVEAFGDPEFDLDTLKEWSNSPDPRLRAAVLNEIGQYWGFDNLDHCPCSFTGAELHQLFPELEKGESLGEPGRRSLRGPRGGVRLLPKVPRDMSEKDWAAWDRWRKALRQRRGLTWSQALPLIGSRR